MAAKKAVKTGRRVAIVDGLRTPFVKSSGKFQSLSTLDLANAVVAELVARSGIDPEVIDEVVYGQVVPSIATPNIAREVVLGTGLPREIEAYSVVRACATSSQSTISATQHLLLGGGEVAISGGADSLSKPPVTFSENFVSVLMEVNKAKDPGGKLKALTKLSPKDLLPNPPAINEFFTGKSMGQHAEEMARKWRISREAQDAYALKSHQKAAAAWEKGIYAQEVMHVHVPPKYETTVVKDDIVRPDTSLEKLASLKPAFDRKYGTLTAGNSSPLTDGASALLLMEEKTAKKLGFEPLAFVTAWELVAVDPKWQLLIGPAIAMPRLCQKAGLKWEQIDLFDIHEAFAAQVLCVLEAVKDDTFAKEHIGIDKAPGEIPEEKLNIYGGSVSLGHPFAATGARQLLTVARELARRGSGKAIVTQCAAGGLGAAVLLER